MKQGRNNYAAVDDDDDDYNDKCMHRPMTRQSSDISVACRAH
jgi:hypothetical protein